MLKIVADSKIPYAEEAFSSFATLQRTTCEELGPDTVREADVLLVRSESRVDESLLGGSRVRFVGSCTIGTDHIDLDYLHDRGLEFANAPGCNARSVAEYVIACILETSLGGKRALKNLSLGVIGQGNVGSLVVDFATALGIRVLVNDPPLEESGTPGDFVPLPDVLACDFVTVHVPLEQRGPHPTHHLVSREELAQLKDGALLINTSRGSVVDGRALLAELRNERLRAVLDVWEHEPKPDLSLVKLVDFATPHIAGYSLDGKLRGTWMVYEALCRFFGLCGGWTGAGLLPAIIPAQLDLSHRRAEDRELLLEVMRARYKIASDDRRMRSLLSLPSEDRASFFRGLRRSYPVRRELPSLEVKLDPSRQELKFQIQSLGAVIKSSAKPARRDRAND